jgi:hypothetical protein
MLACLSFHARTTYSNGQVVASSQLGDFAQASERCSHDNGLVSVLLVVVEDALHTLDTGIFFGTVGLAGLGLVPIHDSAHEWRDEERTGFGTSDGLNKREHQREVAVDLVFGLEDLRGLDAFIGRGNLDKNAVLGDA